MSKETDKYLHIIRNPYGQSEEAVREARVCIANSFESQAREIESLQGYCKTVDQLRAMDQEACNKAWVEIEELRAALEEVIAHDKYVMHQRCPDCDYMCKGECRDMPISEYGKIAQAALTRRKEALK